MVAMLSTGIAATTSQLCYISSHREVAPYISLAMLGVQALGYSVTLVSGARIVPAWPIQSYESSSVKALALTALLLTLWLARARLRARSPLEPGRVPRDGAVLLCTFAVHSCCLLFVLAVHWLSTCGTSATPAPMETNAEDGQVMPPSTNLCTWDRVVGQYVGVVKELILLPQVIANAAWRVNCKPLVGRYYAGITMAWLMPRVYGYIWNPFVGMYAEAHSDIYSASCGGPGRGSYASCRSLCAATLEL